MTKISRTDDADMLANKFRKMKPIALYGGALLICPVFFAEMMIYGFLAMDSSPLATPFAYFIAVTIVLMIFRIYLKQKIADGEFMAYIIDNDKIIHIDITRACANDKLFGESFNFSFGTESKNWAKIISNMKKINTASMVDDFITRPDVTAYCGSYILNVIKVTERKKYVKVRARLKRADGSDGLFSEGTKTLRIPKSFTNADELLMRLRGKQ